MFAAEIARLVDVRVPLVPMSHQYVVTEPVLPPGTTQLPTLRDPDLLVYWRQEVDGLVMGGYERNPAAWTADHRTYDAIPPDFNGRLLPEEWDRFEEITANSQVRVPAMADVGLRKVINGPEAFTPDNEFCLGETDVDGFFVAAGFCAHGIAGAGGIGKVMAEWIVSGDPGMDLWHMDVRRFGRQYRSPSYTLKRTLETYETYYDIVYPGHEREAGRPLRIAPAYEWHRAHGASFGEKAGWERVNHYESNATAGDESERPRGWAGRLWSPAIGVEHRATRETAALFDESSFAKVLVTGPDAADLLQWVCDNDVARGRRRHHLHAGAQPARRHRVGLHRDPAGRRRVHGRHRHRVRVARHVVAAPAGSPPRRGRARRGRHVQPDDVRPLGPERAPRPAGGDRRGPVQRRPPVHDGARDHRRRRAGAGAAGDLRRRARLGALRPERVRRAALDRALGGRPSRTGWSPAATGRSRACGWRRATGCGAPTSPRRPTRGRRGWASASSSTSRAASRAPTRCAR